MDIVFERLKDIQKRRDLKNKQIAEWYPKFGAAAFGRKSKGEEGGFGLREIKKFLDETEVDAAYLFDQIEDFEEADLRKKAVQDLLCRLC